MRLPGVSRSDGAADVFGIYLCKTHVLSSEEGFHNRSMIAAKKKKKNCYQKK
jgi:hypothetical protein